MNIKSIIKHQKTNNRKINMISLKIDNNLTKNPKKCQNIPDNITARWEGFPMPKQQNLLDGDDVGTLLTSQLEGDEEGKAPLTCSQKIIKVIKIIINYKCYKNF